MKITGIVIRGWHHQLLAIPHSSPSFSEGMNAVRDVGDVIPINEFYINGLTQNQPKLFGLSRTWPLSLQFAFSLFRPFPV